MGNSAVAIPSVPPIQDQALAFFLNNFRSAFVNSLSDQSTITIADVNLAIAQALKSYAPPSVTNTSTGTGTGVGTPAFNVYDTATPPALTGLTAVATLDMSILTWDAPAYGNQAFVTIYRANVDNFSSAVKVGETKVNVYADYTGAFGNYYYWIKSTSWGNIEGPINATPGTLASITTIGDLSNTTGTLAANRIVAASLAAVTATLGDVTAGTLSSADGTFNIDLINKAITIAGPAGISAGDYTIIQNGIVQFFKWTGTTHQQGNSLQTIESGTCASGTTVTLSKYYSSMPNIQVFPLSLPTYKAANSGQDQNLVLSVSNPTLSGGVVSFTANAQLVLASNSNVFSSTDTYSGSSNTYSTSTSSPFTTPANSTSIAATLSVSSILGTGTQPNYYNRTVSATLYYKLSSSGTWLTGPTQSVNLASDTVPTPGALTLTQAGLTSGTYNFYISYTASDTGGTFTSGGVSYTYASTTVSSTGSHSYTNSSGWLTVPMNGASITAGYSVYEVDWTFTYDWTKMSGDYSPTIYGPNGSSVLVASGVGLYNTNQSGSGVTSSSFSTSASSYNLMYASGVVAYLNVQSASAVVKSRIAANSATPANVFKITQYSVTLSGATSLASGTVSWLALGN
jgi:hypothetical protein